MKKLNILYTRVSTEEQARSGYSLEYQKNRLLDYCKENNLINYKLIIDDGYSGKNWNRPGIKKIIKYIKNDDVSSLLFLKIDRLSRNIEDYQKLINLCTIHKVNLISLTEEINNSAMGIFTQNLFISMAQMEREQISERTKNGFVGMLEQKKYPFGGKLPLGISKDKNKKLYVNNDIIVVKKIFELNNLGYSYIYITKYINKNFNIKYKSKTQIECILKNTLYQGYKLYGGKKYYLIDNIIKLEEGNVQKIKARKINKHIYLYKELMGDNIVCSSSIKKMANGDKKVYKYYIVKDKNIKINEDLLTNIINENIKKNYYYKRKFIEEKIEKLNKIYIFSEMKEDEYNFLKDNILKQSKKIYKIKNIQRICILENKIKIIFKNKETIEGSF